MKKRLFSLGLITALCATTVLLATGCGDKPYDYDLSEYVKVGNYKGLEYDKVSVSVSQKDIEAEIDDRLEKAAETEESKTGTVKDGDTISVSYEGKIAGKTFEGGSADNSEITIGQTAMIDGFTKGLIGKAVGETVKLDLTFPDDYQEKSVAGKDVVFEVTINNKKITVTPEYNLDFVKKNSEVDTIKAYEASVKKDLLATKKDEALLKIKNGLWEKIISASKAKKYPEDELNAQITKAEESYKALAKQYGVTYEEFVDQYLGYTTKEVDKMLKTTAKSMVLQEMVLYSVAEKEGIEVSDDEYDEYLQDLLKQAGFTEKTYKDSNDGKTIQEFGEENDMRVGLLLNKVMEKVMEYGKEK